MHGAAPDSRGLHGSGPTVQARAACVPSRGACVFSYKQVACCSGGSVSSRGWLEFVEGGLCSLGILALVPSPGLWCRLTVAKVLGPLLSIPGGPTQALPSP